MVVAVNGEELRVAPEFRLVRNGRFLVAELLQPHRVLSTSSRNGGQREDLKYLVNHQSCEGADHRARYSQIINFGDNRYHDTTCAEIELEPNAVAMMGTAANMNYAAVIMAEDGAVQVTAIVTAGVQGNAACASDPAAWRETESGWEKIAHIGGTVNMILLINSPLTEGALARAVMTMTEAKSAALQRLAVRSLYSREIATGTGTDQYCVAALLKKGDPLTSTSPNSKLGELIGITVRNATLEALRWQNGLDASSTRFLFHILGRYGVEEKDFFARLAPLLTECELELLKANFNSVVYEPKVAAAAFAIAAVLDRIRYGALPLSSAQDIFRQQATTLATSLAAKPDRWSDFYSLLYEANPDEPSEAVYGAIALGWSSKWR
jgi:adenosylcobinamide hydrolase